MKKTKTDWSIRRSALQKVENYLRRNEKPRRVSNGKKAKAEDA